MLKELLINQASHDEILAFLEDKHAYDIVQMLSELDSEQQTVIFDLLDPEKLAEVLAYLEPEHAADIINELETSEQKEIVEELEPDDAADIINELPEESRTELIQALDKDEDVLELLGYDENVAGAYMTNDFIAVLASEDVKTATKNVIKKAGEVESIQTIFIIDEENHYLGQISLKDLIKAKSPLTMGDIMVTEPTFNDRAHVNDLVKHMKFYGGYDIAIVNNHHELLGMITMDDILDIYQDEAVEDFEKFTALPDTDFDDNILKISFNRLPWLLSLLVLSTLIALVVTSNFEGILTSVVVLAFFQPLILASGGNVASQTLAVTLISLTNKESDSTKNGIKEIISGILSGFVMSLLAFTVTAIYGHLIQVDHPWLVALVVGVSLWVTVIFAPLLGFLIPTVLKKLKFDPAIASGPFITTLIDVLSSFIYFGFATLLLGGIYYV